MGAGHNGLVAACYLAQAGQPVLVLEQSSQPGGGSRTEKTVPGPLFDVTSIPAELDLPGAIRTTAAVEAELAWPGAHPMHLDIGLDQLASCARAGPRRAPRPWREGAVRQRGRCRAVRRDPRLTRQGSRPSGPRRPTLIA